MLIQTHILHLLDNKQNYTNYYHTLWPEKLSTGSHMIKTYLLIDLNQITQNTEDCLFSWECRKSCKNDRTLG